MPDSSVRILRRDVNLRLPGLVCLVLRVSGVLPPRFWVGLADKFLERRDLLLFRLEGRSSSSIIC
jgi:hypothetical protein